jgi:hypothetical protein
MKIFEKQLWHLLSLLLLLAGIYFLIDRGVVSLAGGLWGISTAAWFKLAIACAVVHHLYVLLNWRLQLRYQWLTRTFGSFAFRLYTIGFHILFAGRMIFIIIVAVANRDTFHLNPVILYTITGIITVLALYAFYSVARYFGMDRAAGIDHFDPKARELPFVKGGIFKYTNNGMYGYALLMLYVPGLLARSDAALLVALFSHIFIWAHYFFTEIPDMKRIYNKTPQL